VFAVKAYSLNRNLAVQQRRSGALEEEEEENDDNNDYDYDYVKYGRSCN
jgi:hypothetical protein